MPLAPIAGTLDTMIKVTKKSRTEEASKQGMHMAKRNIKEQ